MERHRTGSELGAELAQRLLLPDVEHIDGAHQIDAGHSEKNSDVRGGATRDGGTAVVEAHGHVSIRELARPDLCAVAVAEPDT